MNQNEARVLAEAKLREIENPDQPLRLIDALEPEDLVWAWVVRFNSVYYLETGELSAGIVSGPIVVNKDGTDVWVAGSAPPVEQWLNRYAETHGYPQVPLPEVDHFRFS